MEKVKLAIPKGHLAEPTINALEQAGYSISWREASYKPAINDPKIELKILRPQEIPMFVSEGLQDVGITGLDWLYETRADVEVLLNLEYSHVKLVLAIPKAWREIDSLSDLLEVFADEGKPLRVSTEYLNVIIDVIETGTTLEQNDLKPIETVMESTAILIANRDSLRNLEKREKIYDILTLLKGVVDGRKKLHIFVNVHEENLQRLLESLPALRRPTISPLSEKGWYSANTVIEKNRFLELLPALRNIAQGLVVYEPRQVLLLDKINLGDEKVERKSKNQNA